MALYRGREGLLKKAGSSVDQISNWKIDSSMEILDGTALGDTSKVKITGLADWKGSFDTLFDPAMHVDFMNRALDGTTMTDVTFIINGTKNFSGDIIIVGFSPSVAVGDLVKASFTFEGSGDLTYSAT